jgi:hypothetical protein
LSLGIQFSESSHDLALKISDALPSMIREPIIKIKSLSKVVSISCDSGILAQIGGDEPELEVCWIMDSGEGIEKLWARFLKDVSDLLIAGYPGCVDCGGPYSEGVWDELASRARTRV